MKDGVSTLRVQVSTALGALPIEGAVVTVSTPAEETGERTLLYSVTTDEGGMTPPLELSAPPRAESMTPGTTHPFALYTVEVRHPDFVPLAALSVSAFSGVPAVLPVALTPLPENENTAPPQITVPNDPQVLAEPQEGA